MSHNLILIGGGGHCLSCIDVIEHQSNYEIKGILDMESKKGQQLLDVNFIGTDKDIEKYIMEGSSFLVTLGHLRDPTRRIQLFEKIIESGGTLAQVISPFSNVSKHAKIGKGTIIMHGAIVNAGAVIGDNCIINSGALVEHGASVGNHCHISTRAVLNGDVIAGDRVFVGSGAIVREGKTIESDSFIKAQSLVK